MRLRTKAPGALLVGGVYICRPGWSTKELVCMCTTLDMGNKVGKAWGGGGGGDGQEGSGGKEDVSYSQQ